MIRLSVDVPQLMKQKNAFPPNFIHSMDGSHMMLTALYCYRAGVNFASVHDCFWAHGNSVDTMNRICREQFVHMYQQPILETFCEDIVKQYLTQQFRRTIQKKHYNELYRALTTIPPRGDLDITSVLDSVYFFS